MFILDLHPYWKLKVTSSTSSSAQVGIRSIVDRSPTHHSTSFWTNSQWNKQTRKPLNSQLQCSSWICILIESWKLPQVLPQTAHVGIRSIVDQSPTNCSTSFWTNWQWNKQTRKLVTHGSGMVVFLRDVAFIWLPRDRIDDHGLFNHHFYSVSKKAVQSMNV